MSLPTWLAALEGQPAMHLDVARDGRSAVVIGPDRLLWTRATRSAVALPLAKAANTGVCFDSKGQLWHWADGQFTLYGWNGSALTAFESSPSARIVRRGALADRSVVVDDGVIRRLDSMGTELWRLRLDGFMKSDQDVVVNREGTQLAVVGSEGMDAGWGATYAIRDGSMLRDYGSGYGIDAVDFIEGGTVHIDDHRGLSSTRGVMGTALWQTRGASFVQQREGVLQLLDTRKDLWPMHWPSGLAASANGTVVGVICDGRARFRFGWRLE